MKLLISASNALVKWMRIEPPRIPSPDGKRVGVQPLKSDEQILAWQCQVIRAHSRAQQGVVIAVEERSRYTIFMSFERPPTELEFENELRRCWANAFLHYSLDSAAIDEETVPELLYRFSTVPVEYMWYRNTDLSVNGHVADAEQWVKQACDEYRIDHLNENDVMSLEAHINQFAKRVKVNGKRSEPFYPVTRLIDDGLFRFAEGMSRFHHSDCPEGDFPSPYRKQAEETFPSLDTRDNVVLLSEYRHKEKPSD